MALTHIFVVCPTAQRDLANARLEAAGYGSNNFSDGAAYINSSDNDNAPPKFYAIGIQPVYQSGFETALGDIKPDIDFVEGDLDTPNWRGVHEAAKGIRRKPQGNQP